jgi:hypothetical protein
MGKTKIKELVQAQIIRYYPALSAKENNKDTWTLLLLFCITY